MSSKSDQTDENKKDYMDSFFDLVTSSSLSLSLYIYIYDSAIHHVDNDHQLKND
jgi:hypothetical protein